MTRRILISCLMVIAAEIGVGDEYWIGYEGNDFPENEGWLRSFSDPAAERWLEGGSLFIDSRADVDITESYGMKREDGINPEPGETFIARWRLEVHELVGFADPGVSILSDDRYALIFIFSAERVWSALEANVYADFEAGVFHEFEMRSRDMRTYQLYVDGDLAIEGVFRETFSGPGVGFGDIVRGGASLAQWDYLRFGVVPEPSSVILLAYLFNLSLTRRSLT